MRRVVMLLAVGCTVLWTVSAGAEVDWSDMFPEEGQAAPAAAPPPKPAAPAPRPAPPKAAPPPRVEIEPAVEEPPAPAAPARRAAPPVPVEEEPAAQAPPPKKQPQRVAEPEEPAEAAPPPAKAVKPAPVPPAAAPPVERAEPEQVAPPKRAVREAVQAPPAADAEPAPPAAPPKRAAQPAPPPKEAAPEVATASAGIPAAAGIVPLADIGFKEGDFVTAANVDQAADVLSPGMIWGVKYGWNLELIESRPIKLPRVYREATEKYSHQVKMARNGLMLANYVAGQPFPSIDMNDPDAAKKIMWNFYYRAEISDDLDVRLFEGDTGTVGQNQPMEIERHYLIDHLRQLNYNGRLVVDPKPELPNPDGYRRKESIGPLLEPFDLKGVGGLSYRYLDAGRQDDTWLYLPQLRRVRRLSSAQRSDALFGQDSDVDSYYGYNGQVAWNTYRLLGEKVILATMHARHVPVEWQEPANYFFKEVWEPRRVYVVEAVSTLPQYAYSKRVLFIDQEAYVIPYSDIYDRAGQLWKIWVHQYGFRRKTLPEMPTSTEYEDEMAFVNAVTILDTQLAHATRAAQPTTKARGEEGRYINQGAKSGVVEEVFTIAHIISEAH